MSVATKKIAGVESAKVSLNEGKATIQLKPVNAVRLEQVRKAVKEQGFTPRDAKVVAVGDLTLSGGKLQFRVSGSNEVFEVMPTPHLALEKQIGNNLTVTGLISAPADRKGPGTIQITQVLKQSATKQ